MSQTPPDDTDFIHSEQFLRGLMKRQLRLSVSCASAFLLLLLGLPLLNYFAPELMARRVGGFTLSWLVLGVLISAMFKNSPTRRAGRYAGERAAGLAVLKLKMPWHDGTRPLVMSPLKLMQRLAVPAPRHRWPILPVARGPNE